MKELDAVVVGAGQAGLGLSYYLTRDRLQHIVLERGRIGETWLSQRWESFKLNTPNLMNALPGFPYDGPEPHAFCESSELVGYFQRYVKEFQLPVQTGARVFSVKQAENDERYIIETENNGQVEEPIFSRSIIIASGVQNVPRYPPLKTQIPPRITQLHTAHYRSASALPAGAVVVVGSGQSGCQIVEDLLSAGRTVYLCTSKVGRVPRHYRGRDLLEWWVDMKNLDITYDSLADKSISRAAQPQISGVGPYGHTLSLQRLARQGAVVLGHLQDVEASSLVLSDDAAANIRFADEFSRQTKEGIDTFVKNKGITAPQPEDDPADMPDSLAECASPQQRLNLHQADVSTIIWATGFKPDLNWIHLPVLDAEGKLLHQRGVSPLRGLYFIGFPWLISRKSGIIYGVKEDAHFIADTISAQLA